MTESRGEPGVGARSLVLAIGVALIGLSALLVSSLPPHSPMRTLPFDLPWWALIPAYLLAARFSLDLEFRREARSVSLTHIPLTLGVVFLAPGWHLASRLLADIGVFAAARRQPPMKVAFNLGNSAMEVALASAAVSLVTGVDHPDPLLWAALLIGLAANELAGVLSFTAVMRTLRVPVNAGALAGSLAFAATTTFLFTSIAMVSVAAIWTEPWTIVVIAIVTLSLSLAYRVHRRVSAQQQANERLQDFVKDLGAVDVEGPRAGVVLEHVRELLYARTLDVALTSQTDGGWIHYISQVDHPLDRIETDSGDLPVLTASSEDRMSTALVGSHGVIGLITVADRLGSVRAFEMGDVRLLEAVAAELSAALDRGRLLVDLERSATTDALTGLPNLVETTRRIDERLNRGEHLVLAAVAVDSFREVNDTLGHEVGDDLLLEVTRRLRVCVPDALIGRIGGGRFAVAVEADSVGRNAGMFGLGIRAQVEGGAQLGAVGTHVRLSVGAVSGPEHGTDAATLVRRAETAMYSARHAQGGPVIWEPAYEIHGQRRLAVVTALREALVTGAIGVAYQPKVDSRTGICTGVEALARWTHPALGAIRPDEFIPLAQASGLMSPLTSTVLRQALTACKGWQRRASRIGVSVNVSAETVLDPGFVTEIAALLTSVNLAPDLLTLELTEGVLMEDSKLACDRMAEIRACGVKLSVDDFGTGYSSLTYLKGLPIDEVKIDKGFVDAVATDEPDRAVVRAVVDIAHTLGLTVVAEGIEQAEQQRVLAELGVDEFQGYFFGRPMAALDIAQWLRQRDEATARLTQRF